MTQQIQEKVSIVQIAAAIESVLFVSGRPLECAELRRLLDIDEATLAEGGHDGSSALLASTCEPLR